MGDQRIAVPEARTSSPASRMELLAKIVLACLAVLYSTTDAFYINPAVEGFHVAKQLLRRQLLSSPLSSNPHRQNPTGAQGQLSPITGQGITTPPLKGGQMFS